MVQFNIAPVVKIDNSKIDFFPSEDLACQHVLIDTAGELNVAVTGRPKSWAEQFYCD